MNDRIKTMIDAQLPLIGLHTRDTINLPDVILHVCKKTLIMCSFGESPAKGAKPGSVFAMIVPFGTRIAAMPDMDSLYKQMLAREHTCLIINPPEVYDPMFNGGELLTPKQMIHDAMKTVVEDDKKAAKLCTALGGVTIKESTELASLTMTRDSSLTPVGLVETRRTFFQGQQGLTLVDTKQEFYDPHPDLDQFIADEQWSFLNETDHRLVPRGLLFDGPPGVGKTAGARYLARQWGVPLYRFDVGTTQGRYVGDSEGNMANNLARLDNEEPCVVLIDEIEKIFSTKEQDTSGVTSRMMSQLLWWLSERESRVFVVMTTNKMEAIPPELHRARRIDKTMAFCGMNKTEAKEFVTHLILTFPDVDCGSAQMAAEKIVATAFKKEAATMLSHATLTEATYKFIKQIKAKTAKT